jgi:hypothetical protein
MPWLDLWHQVGVNWSPDQPSLDAGFACSLSAIVLTIRAAQNDD